MMWVEQYIGDPWVAGSNDCWNFARKIWREHFGLDVPAVDVDACSRMACSRSFHDHDAYAQWREVDKPMDGDAVLIGKSTRPSHVGVHVGGRVLHCMQGHGVAWQPAQSLSPSGWRVVGYYRHRSMP